MPPPIEPDPAPFEAPADPVFQAIDEKALRAPTPPPMFPRRSVPIPARSLQLEPVATDESSRLSGPVLENYVRNEGEEEVKVLRDLPFGEAFTHGDMPFHVEAGSTPLASGDDADTEGIPTGLPDLIAFSDVSVSPSPVEPEEVEKVPVQAPEQPWGLVAGAFIGGCILGAACMALIG